MTTVKLICSVYKSVEMDYMYLYVDKQEGLRRVPEALLNTFGKPVHALTFMLEPGRRLAREDADQVLENIRNHGYHLQFPPVPEDLLPAQYTSLKNT